MQTVWQHINPRERKLAVVVACLLAAGVVGIFTKRALTRIQELDDVILRYQTSLVDYTQLVARSQSVDDAYRQIASQHSSAWTEAEIHDRLRQEIYRLAMRNPPPVGVPFSPTKTDVLVSIPTLQQGNLRTDARGFREYQLSLRIPETSVANLFTFLERLQGSAQSLRIVGLDVSRPPQGELVTAAIDVTRTVVDDVPNAGTQGAEENTQVAGDEIGTARDDWQAQGLELAQVKERVSRGIDCIKARAATPNATAFLRQNLEPGASYELTMDLAAFGPGRLDVMNDADQALFRGGQELAADGQPRQYVLRFVVPVEARPEVAVRVPFITVTQEGTDIYIDNIMLEKTTG